MPQLPTFTAKVPDAPISGGRRAGAEDFGTGYGDVGDKIRKGVSDFQSDLEDTETRAALVASAEIRAQYAKELDDAQLSGAPVEPLREKMDADLQKIGENFVTKKGGESVAVYTSNAHLMFDEQANAINVRRASAAARLDFQKFTNAQFQMIARDPSYLARATQDAQEFMSTIPGVTPELRAELSARATEEMNYAAALSVARIDPDAAIKRLEAGEFDLDPGKREAALGHARGALNIRKAAEAEDRRLKREAAADADNAASDRITRAILSMKPGNAREIERAIVDDPALTDNSRRTLTMFLEHRAKPKGDGTGANIKTDERVLNRLLMGIASGEIVNNQPILEAAAKGQLDPGALRVALAEVRGMKDENNQSIGAKLTQMQSSFRERLAREPMFTAQPDKVDQALNLYQAEIRAAVEAAREGKGATRADIDALFRPDAKGSVASEEFRRGIIERVKAGARDSAAVPSAGMEVERGGETWRFRGGDPKLPANWEKVGASAAPAPAPTETREQALARQKAERQRRDAGGR